LPLDRQRPHVAFGLISRCCDRQFRENCIGSAAGENAADAPSYLEKNPAPAKPSDLALHNCVRYSFYPYGADWRFEDRDGGIVSAPIKGNLVTNNAETLRGFALDGRGIFLAPSFLIADDIAQGSLVRLLPDYRPVEFTISAIYANRAHLPAKIRLFLDMMAERFAQYRQWLNAD
jgi:DNA-binding transcriptional LysR family regulator